jgi:catechol 2,3-dioxygenase-like lactoylglutathione lyase family enzyme
MAGEVAGAAGSDGGMVSGIDRVQLAVADLDAAAATWKRLFGAEAVRDDRVRPLGARRRVLRAGASEIELLEPDGIGEVAQHLARSRSAVFAAGLSTPDLERARRLLDARGVHHLAHGAQLLITGSWLGVPALRVVLSQEERREPAGLLGHVYEVTHLTRGFGRAAERLAKVFDLDPGAFVPIRSDEFGYEGLLAMLRPGRLDRVETVAPRDRTKAMGRFFERQGPCLYMLYAEATDTATIRNRLAEHAAGRWTGPREGVPDNLFVHPRALHGALLGVSRDEVAWRWSGGPQRGE